MSRPSVITAMLICRDHILRLGVQTIFSSRQPIRLVGLPAAAKGMEEQLTREHPQVIIVDSEAEMDLAGLIQKIKVLVPNGKIALLVGFEAEWDTISNGVDDIILKVQPPAALIASIETLCGLPASPVHNPDSMHAKPAFKRAANDSERMAAGSQQYGSLTEREREILELIGEGLANKDIANRLCISVITVRHHLTNIFDKLGVATRQKLLIRAYQYGLVEFAVPA